MLKCSDQYQQIGLEEDNWPEKTDDKGKVPKPKHVIVSVVSQ